MTAKLAGRLPFALLVLLATWALAGAAAQSPPGLATGDEIGYLEGRIVSIDDAGERRSARVELNDGSTVSAELPFDDPNAPEGLPSFAVGDRVEVYYSPGPDGDRVHAVSDWVRRPSLLVLSGLFLLVAVAVARFKGLRAVLATAASLGIIVAYVVPGIVAGGNPVTISLAGAGGILVIAIYFVHGLSWSTTAALAGTFVATLVTMALGLGFSGWSRLTGFGSEEGFLISSAAPDVALRGLLLAGLLIGALGALTDITIVQAAVVRELAHTDPTLGWRELYRGGMAVGLDHIGSLVNTLVLAYAGSALPLLVLLTAGDFGLARALNMEIIASEVVHTLVGSIGLILSVPVTTALSALLFRGDRLPLRRGELEAGHHHG